MHHAIGRAEHPCAERLQEKLEKSADEAIRQIGADFGKPALDGPETVRHAPLERREIVPLPALVLPALERTGQEVEFGKNVAEPRREHLLALERAAEGQQRQVGGKRKARGVARELTIETRRIARVRRGREQPKAPA